jgi:hypothetical protein
VGKGSHRTVDACYGLDLGDDFTSMDQRSCDIAGMVELPTGDGDVV